MCLSGDGPYRRSVDPPCLDGPSALAPCWGCSFVRRQRVDRRANLIASHTRWKDGAAPWGIRYLRRASDPVAFRLGYQPQCIVRQQETPRHEIFGGLLEGSDVSLARRIALFDRRAGVTGRDALCFSITVALWSPDVSTSLNQGLRYQFSDFGEPFWAVSSSMRHHQTCQMPRSNCNARPRPPVESWLAVPLQLEVTLSL